MTGIGETPAARWAGLKARAAAAADEAFRPRSGGTVLVGDATCGRSAGSRALADAARAEAGRLGLDLRVLPGGCLGHCYAEPMAVFFGPALPPLLYGYLTPDMMTALVGKLYVEGDPVPDWSMGALEENDAIPCVTEVERFRREERRLLARCGLIDPTAILHAIARGCYGGFIRALGLPPAGIIDEIRRSGLRGLGGAGFAAWKKWAACAEAGSGRKIVVCNADEGDPGAFMDRAILESDPHAVIEGMLVAARATGSREGFIYVRREYPLAVERFSAAVAGAMSEGLLGSDILGSGMDFSIRVREGAGAFVCGESTALILSLEGKRGMPRVKPPRSAVAGYEGCPTLLSNVKTFASCGPILDRGAAWFASIGTTGSKGTAVFALAGKVRQTGLVEVPMGTPLREIVFDLGGGIAPFVRTSDVAGEAVAPSCARRFKAVQIGGPSGGWVPENLLDTPVDFDAFDRAGAMMGSGGLVVIDEDNCIVSATTYFMRFTQKESCGKCTFCRIGTWHMLRILERITRGEGKEGDLAALESLAEDVRRGSLCNLGRTAPNPVLSSLRHFRDEYEAHIREKRCPAGECQALISYVILPERCRRGCEACLGSCPSDSISTREDGLKQIDPKTCVACGACLSACPSRYDAVVRVSPKPIG
jgi:NADH-quinone oxidoreductase subunit F